MQVVLLGDPHLGRAFPNAPLHRRGEREASQLVDFTASLAQPGDVHICMGDLFDKPVVPYKVILAAYQLYVNAPKEKTYFIIRGNHDIFRESNRPSAFDVFSELVGWLDNVVVVRDEPSFFGDAIIVPWQPFRSSEDYLSGVGAEVKTAYGHWDVVVIGDKNQNRVPIKALKGMGVETVYTGHDHREGELMIDGVKVIKTGSMQPYAHGEGALYVTVDPDKLEDPTLVNKCVRVRLAPGEDAPPPIDCLEWSIIRTKPDDSDASEEVSLDEFNFRSVLTEAFDTCEVPLPTRTLLVDKLEESDQISA